MNRVLPPNNSKTDNGNSIVIISPGSNPLKLKPKTKMERLEAIHFSTMKKTGARKKRIILLLLTNF